MVPIPIMFHFFWNSIATECKQYVCNIISECKNTTIQKLGIIKIFFLKKLKLLFIKDGSNRSKMTVKTFMLEIVVINYNVRQLSNYLFSNKCSLSLRKRFISRTLQNLADPKHLNSSIHAINLKIIFRGNHNNTTNAVE